MKVFWKETDLRTYCLLVEPASKLLTLYNLKDNQYKLECLGNRQFFTATDLEEAKKLCIVTLGWILDAVKEGLQLV